MTKFSKLPQLMQDAMQVLNELHETPDELSMPAVLGVANLAVMPHYKINSYLFGEVPLSLFILSILPTGARKSTTYKEICNGIEKYEKERWKELKDEPLRYSLAMKAFEKAKTKYLRELDDQNVVAPQLPIEPTPIETTKYRIGKATLNGVIDQLRSQSFVGLFSSEAGEFFNSHAFQGSRDISKAIEMSASLTSMWDGSTIDKQTGIESVRFYNRAVSMMFFLQEETVRDVLNNPTFSAQGFVHRILISQANQFESAERDLTDEGLTKITAIRAKLEPFHDRIYQLISKPLKIKQVNNIGTMGPFELDRDTIEIDLEGRKVLQDFFNANRNRGRSDLQSWAGFSDRLYEHTIRIAGTLAAFESKTVVGKLEAEGAVELMNFFIEQRLKLELGVNSNNPNQVMATQKLLDWMKLKKFNGLKSQLRSNIRWFKALTRDEQNKILEDLVLSKLVTVDSDEKYSVM